MLCPFMLCPFMLCPFMWGNGVAAGKPLKKINASGSMQIYPAVTWGLA